MAVKKRHSASHIKLSVVAIEHTEFYPYLLKYQEAMQVRGYKATTLRKRDSSLRRFIAWCDDRSIDHPNQVTKPILERYQKYLFHYRQENDKSLSARTQNQYITSIKQFFKYLTQENYLLFNPASELRMMKQVTRLPVVLSEAEIENLIEQPKLSKAEGVRDRAILELFYSTGIRRAELCRLELQDLSLSRKTVFIRQGKGGKDRLIPVGNRALYWLDKYVNGVRDQFLMDIHNETLFLNDYGEMFRGTKLGDKVKRYMRKAGIDVPGSCHLLRHAMATHMLENGAETRFIQAMLGHTSLSTTQIYTHVSIRKLQEVHEQTHPAKLIHQ